MVHKKKFTKKRVHSKKKGPTTKTLAKRVKKIENEYMELKWVDELNSNSGVAIPVGGWVATLNNFAEGNTVNTRVGQKVYLTSIQLKILWANNVSFLGAQNIRVMLVLDKAHNGNAATFDGVPLGNGASAILDNSVITLPSLMPRTYETRYRYRVLYDKVHCLNPHWENAGTTAVLGCINRTVKNIRLGVVTTYQDATGSIASILKNSLCLFVTSDNAGATGPTVAIGTRIYFKDA